MEVVIMDKNRYPEKGLTLLSTEMFKLSLNPTKSTEQRKRFNNGKKN